MAVIETWLNQDLQEPVKVRHLNGNLFSDNGKANRIGVILTDGGEAATISGTVSGYVVTADGSTVPCTGSKSGNKASILLPAAAYQPGAVFITVFVTDGTTVTTIGAVAATVALAKTGTQVDPGSVVTDWTDTINAAMQAVETAADNLGGIIAVPYASITFPVPLGKYTYHNDNLYRCISPIATSENFTAAHWTQVRLGDDVADLKSAINDTIHRFEVINVEFNPSTGYIVSNGAVGSTVSLSPTSSQLYKYTYLPCNKGDIFIVNAVGGISPRAWCFTDDDLKIISNAGNNATVTDKMFVAPADGYFICNNSVSNTSGYVKYVRKIDDVIDELIYGSSTQNMAGLPNKDFYYSVSDGCIVNRGSTLVASTGLIKVVPGCTYQWRGAAAKTEGGYFAKGAKLAAGVESITDITFTTLNQISIFTVPDGVSYVMLNITMTDQSTIGAYYLNYGYYQTANLLFKKSANILDLYPLSDIIKAYRVFRQSDGYTSVNVVAGYEKNYVARDLHGCTISGGGFPGYSNKIGALTSNVWDGTSPSSEKQENDSPITGTGADFSVIGGGYDNVANGLASVLTGFHCIIDTTATHGTISGGSLHKIQACDYSTICGGTQNRIISGSSGVIVGGSHNYVSGQWGQILGGDGNTASGKNAVAIGRDNTAAYENSFAHGKGAVTTNYGQDAWSTYPLSQNGDRQVSRYQLFTKTTNTTAKYLETNLNTRATLLDGFIWLYEIKVIAKSSTKAKAWIAKGCAQRADLTITPIGTPNIETFGDASDLNFSIGYGQSSILFTCTGNNEEVQWFAELEAVQLKI